MKHQVKREPDTTIVRTGLALLQRKLNYTQKQIVEKLKLLGFEVSASSISNIIDKGNTGRPVGLTAFRIASEGFKALLSKELDMGFNPVTNNFEPLGTPDWVPFQVPDKSKVARPPFLIHSYGRVQLDQKTQFIDAAQVEVIEVGVRLNSFSSYFTSQNEQAYKMHIIEMLKRGVHFKGYLIDPNSKEAQSYFTDRAKSLPAEQDSIHEIKKIIGRLKELCLEFKAMNLKGTFEIYLYQHIPVSLFYVVDGATEQGKMMVSPYLYGVRRANCPVIEFSKQHDRVLFTKYWESIQFFIQGAEKIV